MGVLFLLTAPILFGRMSAQVVTGPDDAPTGNNEIVIWRAEAPSARSLRMPAVIPPRLIAAAETIGYTIRLQSFPAQQFAQSLFSAAETHQEPDVIFLSNHMLLTGGKTAEGDLTGIEQTADIRKNLVEVTELMSGRNQVGTAWSGWQYLLSTSKHYAAARMLAMRAPDCEGVPVSDPVPNDLASLAEKVSDAYLEHSSLSSYEDVKRLKTDGARRGPVQVDETKACGAWGNERLSFLSLVSSYHSQAAVGHIHVLVVLRKPRDEWRLLAVSTDPISNSAFLDQLAANTRAFRLPAAGVLEPEAATLVSPGDRLYPQPADGERFGNFRWLPSPEPGVVAEVAEFSYRNDTRLFLRIPSQSKDEDPVSAGRLWTTGGEWRWRVWSVTDRGDVAFSTTHTFTH